MTDSGVMTRVLGTRGIAGLARLFPGLRVLAYHGVPDVEAFHRQMAYLARNFAVVEAVDVLAASRSERALPPRAVWVTFDDGHPDVVANGMPVLEEFRIAATLFVCPSVIGTDTPYWWQIVEAAATASIPAALVPGQRHVGPSLKLLPDDERRAAVEALRAALVERGVTVTARQLTFSELDRWCAAGHTVGSHTWDHPCLDRCDPAAQASQIERADHALAAYLTSARLFAYPNGNWAPQAEEALRRLDYDVAVVFDHRLAHPSRNPLRMSRLRVDSDASLPRFRAIVSGAHSLGYRVRRRPSRAKA